ncbi:hypothetical protein Nepgr_011014 [Nepenthes gracilis]|uniref:Uncharacterized protein n=1 Tax=Nepenthes gracilis TaxID=150966 RepID=A0AAD3SE24_NEPGR|nr:hypothetical protein Nepgr_011014 [Nepenthes gracilis]
MLVAAALTEVLVASPSAAGYRTLQLKRSTVSSFSDSSSLFRLESRSCPFCVPKLARELDKYRAKGLTVRVAENSGENLASIAPLHLESPVGQLLAQILQTHPHLLPATIDQQLQKLQNDRDAEKEESPSSSQDLLLFKRIAEVKEKDRQKALEEIVYCLVVHKFVENDILMIPKITQTSDPTGRADFWPSQEQKLESIHSPEAFEMIQSHLDSVLGERLVGPLQTMVEMSKIKLGKLYAASIIYGYFLKRVDQRYQLERAMKTLPKNLSEKEVGFRDPGLMNQLWDPGLLSQQDPSNEDGESHGGEKADYGSNNSYMLRSYVMYLDAETLRRYATIRSKEVTSLIEKQTQALFGRPDIRLAEDGSLEAHNDEILAISFSGVTMLVLEAVAFGSFLWDAEDYAESIYHFVKG